MRFVIVIIWLLMILSCNTVKEGFKSSKIVTSKGNEVLITTKEGKVEITSPVVPGMSFSGTLSDNTIYITQVRLFSNWQNGWTEGFYQASGKYYVEATGKGYLLKEIDALEIWNIESGEIRYRGNYYREDDGLQKVRNRVDRIEEYVKVIKEKGGPEFLGDIKKGNSISSYTIKKFLYPVLFPEVVGFNKIEKSNMMQKAYYKSDYEKVKVPGSNIYWRDDYTKSIFPEHLWELRNSGTIFRDFEEAPNIVISYYNLDGFIKSKLNNCRLLKIED